MKKLLSLLLVGVMVFSLVACGTKENNDDAGNEKDTKEVSELIIGELHYSVVEDGGWAQAMHEGIVKA